MACDCGGKTNQTPKEAIKHLGAHNLDLHNEKGAGLFLLPDPAAGPRRFRKILVHDLNYEDAHVRGTHTLAFKWFPYAWRDKSTVSKLDMHPCHGEPCSSDDECEQLGIECFCFQGECA